MYGAICLCVACFVCATSITPASWVKAAALATVGYGGQVAGLLTYMKRRMLEQEAKVAADFGEGKSGHLGSTATMHDIEDLLVVATLSKRSCLALSGTPSSSLSSVLPQRHCSSCGRTHTPT